MQLSDIRTRVRYYLRETTANVWLDAELTALINLASRHVAVRLIPELLPQLIQVGAISYTAASNANLPNQYCKPAGTPFNASTGVQFPLLPISKAMEYKAKGLDADSLFTSRTFSWIQNQDLYLPDAVTATISMPYVQYPTDLSADGDVSEIEDGFIDLVIIKASADALIKTRQLQDSNLLYKMLEDRIEKINRGNQ